MFMALILPIKIRHNLLPFPYAGSFAEVEGYEDENLKTFNICRRFYILRFDVGIGAKG